MIYLINDLFERVGGFNLKHKIPILITLALALALLVSATSLTSLAVHEDHSNPNSTAERLTLDSADILELALGIELSEAERSYLAVYGGESISYSNMIPASYVVTAYDDESGMLTVYAREYEYYTSAGLEKIWTPKIATVGDISVPLALGSGDKYVAEIEGVTEDEATVLDVYYTMSVTASAKTLNSLINKAFEDAPAWAEYDGYLEAREEYYAAFAAYEKYLVDKSVYDAKLEEYEAYLDELAEYEADLLVYTEYEAALAQYNTDYAKYLDYLDKLDKYDADMALYNKYLADLATVDYHLSILDGTIAASTPLNRSVRNAIMGQTVTQVLENRDIIANDISGVKPEVVDNAGTYTENLRVFYSEYESIKDKQEKYTYYVMNYQKIRDNFVGLFKCLDRLYESGYVREGIYRRGMTEKYEILLAQLYYTVMAISDDPVLNYDGTAYYGSAYKIDLKTPISILYGAPYMKDLGDAAPLTGGYPTEVKKPNEVTKVDEPVKPNAVLRPVEPEVVYDPGDEPDVVVKPTVPVAVEPPITLADQYVLPDAVVSLVSAYKNGGICARDEVSQSEKITLEAVASKKIFGTREIAISFHDVEGALLDTVNVERGSYVEFSGALPTKAEDDSATYTFSGWQDSDGNPVDMRAVDCDGQTLNLYPSFNINYKLYEVTWIVEGKKTITKERLGVIPTAPFTPSKSDTGSFLYEFKGWNCDLTPVSTKSSENVYTALFESKFIVPFSNDSGAVITTDETGYTIDATASPENTFDLSNVIPRAAGKGGLVLRTKDYTAKFAYNEVLAMSTAEVKRVIVHSAANGAYGYSFYVDMLGTDGEKIAGGIKASVTLPYSFSDLSHARLYYLADGVRHYVKANVTETSLSATVNCGTVYYAGLFYAVDVIALDTVKVSVSDTLLQAGNVGTISVEAPPGIGIVSYYLIKGNGERINLDGPEFVMPTDSVSVGVVYSHLKYTVKFVSDGTVISIATYTYGEQPLIPANPKKSADELYSYEFVGWDAEISAVTSDATYNAVYESTPLPVVQKPDGLQISDGVLALIVKVLVLVAYGCVVVLPLLVVVAVKLVHRIKWFKPRSRS